MCGSASERTRAISWGEMVIAEFSWAIRCSRRGISVAARFSEPGGLAKEANLEFVARMSQTDLSRAALLDELRHGGAQFGDAGAAARGGHEHLRVRRGVLGERGLGRRDERRELGMLRRVGLGQHDLVV